MQYPSNKIRRGLENAIKKLFPSFMEKLSSIDNNICIYLIFQVCHFTNETLYLWQPFQYLNNRPQRNHNIIKTSPEFPSPCRIPRYCICTYLKQPDLPKISGIILSYSLWQTVLNLGHAWLADVCAVKIYTNKPPKGYERIILRF